MRTLHLRSRRPRREGFTLVEIMIVVVIIGLLAALAVPAFMRIQAASRHTRIANDFRVFAQTFEVYNMEHGFWPSSAGAGVVPTLPSPMNGQFRVETWQTKTAIGGAWNWDEGVPAFAAGISISGFTCDDTELTVIDAKIDDGNLNTGNFQKTAANRVTLILQL